MKCKYEARTRNKMRYLEESDDGDLVVLDELLGSIDVLEGDGRRSGLLLDPGNDGFGSSASIVFHSLAITTKRLLSFIFVPIKLKTFFGCLNNLNLV